MRTKNNNWIKLFVFIAILFCMKGCRKSADVAAKKETHQQNTAQKQTVTQEQTDISDKAVAIVGDDVITADALENYLILQPIPDYVQDVGKIVDSRLDELIVSELLSHEALRVQLNERPDVRYRIQQLLAHSLIEEMVNKPVYEDKITDQELQAYYIEYINEFKRPAMVRLSDIFIAVDPKTAEKERKERLELAERILIDARKAYGRVAFGKLVLKYSDTPVIYEKGNTGYFDINGSPVGIEVTMAKEAFKLQRIGQVADKIIKTTDGYHIIMLSGKRDALDNPLSKIKGQLTQRIRREKLETARKQYIEELKSKANITVNTDMVKTIAKQLNEKISQQRKTRSGSFPALPPVAPSKTAMPRGPRANKKKKQSL